MRKLIVALALALIGTLVYVQRDASVRTAVQPTEASPPSADPAGESELQGLEGVAGGSRSESLQPEEPVAGSPAGSSDTEEAPRLHGKVTAYLPDGREEATVEGLLVVTFYSEPKLVEVPVREGTFETDRKASDFSYVNGLLGSEKVGLLRQIERGALQPDEQGFLSVEVAWTHEALLHVLDADSDTPLSGIEVWRGLLGAPPAELPESRRILQGATSPIVLRPNPSQWVRPEAEYWVRAEGTGWGKVIIDHGSAVEDTLRLETAGSARLTVRECRDPRVQLSVWQYGEDGVPVGILACEPPAEAAEQSVGPLRPGTWRARLVLRAPTGEQELLDSVDFEVLVGRETPVDLTYTPPPKAPARVPLGGTLVVDAGWELKSPLLKVVPISVQEWPGWCDAGDPEALRLTDLDGLQSSSGAPWTAGKVRPGEYLLTLHDGNFTSLHAWQVVVDPRGRDDLTLELGKPWVLSLRAVDATSGEPIPPEELHVTLPQPIGPRLAPSGSVDVGGAALALSLAPSSGALLVSSEGYIPEEVQVSPGTSSLDVELAPQACLVLTLLDQGRPVNLTFVAGNSARISPVESPQVSYGMNALYDQAGVLIQHLDEPGEYRVRIPQLAGFQPVEPFTVELAAGQRVERTIALRRAE